MEINKVQLNQDLKKAEEEKQEEGVRGWRNINKF